MRVCLVSGEFPPMQGGVGDYTQELGAALADLGHEVTVLTSTAAAGPECRRGCRVLATVNGWGWRSWRALGELTARERPDVVHIQYQTAAYGMQPAMNLWPASRRAGKGPRPAVLVTFHDLLVPFLFRGAGPLRPWVTDVLARCADGIIATNEDDDARLTRRAPAVPRRLIPIGSNIAPQPPAGYDRQAWRQRWGLELGEFVLCYFGFLNRSKGGEELVQAVGRLVEGGHPVRLLLVGGKVGASDPTNVTYLAQVEALIGRLGLGERVIWTDYLPQAEVSAALLAADACVLPYRDGVSTRRGALMAALTHGLPIVSTNPQVPSVWFRDGENVLLVPPESPEALAGAVERLIQDAALRGRLSAGAINLSRRFLWPAIAVATAGFYSELITRQSR